MEQSKECKESLICLAINTVAVRFLPELKAMSDEEQNAYNRILNEHGQLTRKLCEGNGLVELHKCVWPFLQRGNNITEQLEDLKNLQGLVAFFRRPRSLVALHKIGINYCSDGRQELESVEEALVELERRALAGPVGGRALLDGNAHPRRQVPKAFVTDHR